MEIGTEEYYRTTTLTGFFNDNDREFLAEYLLENLKRLRQRIIVQMFFLMDALNH